METRTRATDVAEIAKRLDSKVNFYGIKFSQVHPSEQGQTINDLCFLYRKYGVYFYTSTSKLDQLHKLTDVELPIYVGIDESKGIYELTKF